MKHKLLNPNLRSAERQRLPRRRYFPVENDPLTETLDSYREESDESETVRFCFSLSLRSSERFETFECFGRFYPFSRR